MFVHQHLPLNTGEFNLEILKQKHVRCNVNMELGTLVKCQTKIQ